MLVVHHGEVGGEARHGESPAVRDCADALLRRGIELDTAREIQCHSGVRNSRARIPRCPLQIFKPRLQIPVLSDDIPGLRAEE
jgi:hypothetical protein